MQVTVKAPAKLNLTLDVVGTRADGYHLLESIMQTVDRYDTLTAIRAEEITLTVVGGDPCPTEKNTAYKAARAFFRETGIAGGVAMTLEKTIPQQAGMGGGSADAAAALWALNRLYDTRLSAEKLCAIGVQVGADVPFCVLGGTAFVTGIGEGLQPLLPLPDCYIVVAKPDEGVSTAEAYAAIDRASCLRHPDHDKALNAIAAGNLPAVCAQAVNVFEEVTALPGVQAIRQTMDAFSPLCSRMTGSGSAVFAVFANREQAEACAARLKQGWPTVFLCRPCSGVEIFSE
ncbi:MAG: 4-(cytidine 5'-diphospho)-2-C-methyl-D-erythritol kinase [Clostridia bacterium]|nr:4-(cytidine 5'-diphospho)-2-C-methyl-D-erythritol kinase [Clostridia bacterium]